MDLAVSAFNSSTLCFFSILGLISSKDTSLFLITSPTTMPQNLSSRFLVYSIISGLAPNSSSLAIAPCLLANLYKEYKVKKLNISLMA